MATGLGRIYPLFHSGFYCTRGSAAPRNLQRSHPLVAAEKRLEELSEARIREAEEWGWRSANSQLI
jgi:hypothetical protein